MNLQLVEHFYSFQGEPQSQGKPAYFIRFPGCNLKCGFCDTLYASRVTKGKKVDLSHLYAEILKTNCKLIVITGGEPLLKKKEILELHRYLPEDYIFEIETNGTQYPLTFVGGKKREIRYNVSPKLSSSGNTLKTRFQPLVLKSLLNKQSILKFVVKNLTDLKEVDGIVKVIGIPKSLVWIMPEGKRDSQVRKHALKYVNKIKEKGYSLTSRLHIWLYGQKRGI